MHGGESKGEAAHPQKITKVGTYDIGDGAGATVGDRSLQSGGWGLGGTMHFGSPDSSGL